MAREKRRAAGRGTRDGLAAAFEKVYRSDETPSLQDFLDLGRELNEARLFDFIEESIQGNQQAKAIPRNLLFTAARVHQNVHAGDTAHLEGLIGQTNTGKYWPRVRDEIVKFAKQAYRELDERVPPLVSEPPAKVVRDRQTESRDKWIYEKCRQGEAYDSIARNLPKQNPRWTRISSKQGILAAARRYARRHKLPPPPPRQER